MFQQPFETIMSFPDFPLFFGVFFFLFFFSLLQFGFVNGSLYRRFLMKGVSLAVAGSKKDERLGRLFEAWAAVVARLRDTRGRIETGTEFKPGFIVTRILLLALSAAVPDFGPAPPCSHSSFT